MAKHSKNPPTLYDVIMAKQSKLSDRLTKDSPGQQKLKSARVFALDSDASRLVGQLLKSAAPLILKQHEFARPPFNQSWIEIDFQAYIEGLDAYRKGDDKTADRRVGYFFSDGHLLFASEDGVGAAHMVPIWFDMHQPVSFEEELEMAQRFGLSRLVYRNAIVGGASDDSIDEDIVRDVCRSHKLRISSLLDGMPERALRQILLGGAGSLKQGIALALLLTRPGSAVITLHEQDRRHGIIKGQTRVLAPHHVVTLHLQRDMAMHKVIEALHSTGRHNRWHDVRGHWCQTRNPKYASCQHDWQPVNVNRYECIKAGCKAKRWWKADHHRGDPSLGNVSKTYEVTK